MRRRMLCLSLSPLLSAFCKTYAQNDYLCPCTYAGIFLWTQLAFEKPRCHKDLLHGAYYDRQILWVLSLSFYSFLPYFSPTSRQLFCVSRAVWNHPTFLWVLLLIRRRRRNSTTKKRMLLQPVRYQRCTRCVDWWIDCIRLCPFPILSHFRENHDLATDS